MREDAFRLGRKILTISAWPLVGPIADRSDTQNHESQNHNSILMII